MNETTTPPTQAERDFAFRYYKEECLHTYDGPAHQCTNEHDISNGSMIVFGYWEQRNNDCWFNQLLEDEAPPFRAPWSSTEEFLVRVRELLELYPDVKYLTMDRPGHESFSGVFEGTTTDVRQDERHAH